MILQALARYYELLCSDPDSVIARPGFSSVGVSYALNLSEQGELHEIIPQFELVQRGKKLEERPRRMLLPEQVKRTVAPLPNFLWDNAAFVLGVTDKDAASPDYALKRFEAFRALHEALLDGARSPAAQAVLAFLRAWQPLEARQHPAVAASLEGLLNGGNLVFLVNGAYAHEDQAARAAWANYKAGKQAVAGQCLVTGEIAPIARLHASLKGVPGANSTGASLVAFNERAYESYNRLKGQGLNAPVSEQAVFAYTTALNYLLSPANPNKKFVMGDTSVVYWAESSNPAFADAFEGLFDPALVEEPLPVDRQAGRKRAENALGAAAEKVRRVQKLDVDALLRDLGDENPRFYVLGLAPNAARISVRFFLTDPFQAFVQRIMQHYKDLEIVKEYKDQPGYITVGHILAETVSKKAKDPQASPLLAGAVFRAILGGGPYPAALYNAIITRIRADSDDKQVKKINYVRAAVIKACLLRKYRNHPRFQEVLVMPLNPQATIPAYVLGRLFAVLEKVQQEAIGSVNASIKDRYFTSACATPASVFPVLLRLSQHHINKAKYGRAADRRIQDILNLLDLDNNPIPAHLSLDEQGVFVLGYYHQRAALYEPNAGHPDADELAVSEAEDSDSDTL